MKNYFPKAVRGISYSGYIRINRAQLNKLFENKEFKFNGFIVGNKVNSFHFFGGWHLAWTLNDRSKEEMKEAIQGFERHLDRELGTQAAIFLKK